MSNPVIVVYGASGTTGTLVAERIAATGAHVVLAGRDRARLNAVATRLRGPAVSVVVAAAHDRAALARAFTGAQVVVGCAGPFTRIGGGLVAAALAAGASWLDVAGEQAFLRTVFEEHESAARRAGLAVVGGLGVEVGLGDWAARCAAAAVLGQPERGATTDRLTDGIDERSESTRRGDPTGFAGGAGGRAPRGIDAIEIGYALDEFVPTPGTQRSILATLRGPGHTWRAHRWDPARAGARKLDLNFGALGPRVARWFPAGEVITVPRHLDVAAVDTFVALGGAWAIYERAAPLFALAASAAGGLLDAMLAPLIDPTRLPDAETRARARFAIVAHARRGFDRSVVTITGADVYATTARIAADAAVELATRTDGPTGVLAPSQAFAAAPRLHALMDAGVIEIS